MTLPSGIRWSSSGRVSATHWRSVTSNTAERRLEAVSSGPNRRKFVFCLMMSRRKAPMIRVASPSPRPGASIATA